MLTAAVMVPLGAQAQFLTNGGFEGDGVAGVAPTGWDTNPSGGSLLTSSDYAQSGSYSLMIDSTGAGAWASPNAFQSFSASPGDEYNFSGYMLMPGTNPITDASFGLLKVEFRDTGGNLLDVAGNVSIGGAAAAPFFGAESDPFINSGSATDAWIFTETQVVAPTGTVEAAFYLLNVNQGVAPSPIYFDSVSVTVVPEPGVFALLGGLSVLGFVLFRRFKRN